MHVIGTAGHVDHGKSALVAALTGTHPDRLKEEQEREMTIDLGFAWMSLPGGEEIGIIDVPGHRDFIENMLSGVGGIDAAMLVVAADEGIMPQTREHLAILDLLQVNAGVIVLTKMDLVMDADWLDMLEEEIHAVVKNTILEASPIMKVSARTGAGLEELKLALAELLKTTPPRRDLGRPRLPVDRVFSISGFGSVLTGTLSDGRLVVGDEVMVLPSGLHGRVRGLQTHHKKEDVAYPGSRTAINISGLTLDQVQRGNVVTYPGLYSPSKRLDVSFRLLPDASSPVMHHMQVKFFIGSSETIADVRLLGKEAIKPGESGWLQLELHSPVVAARGDRFILRRPSPGETIGGGKVIDPYPKARHKRFDPKVLQTLEVMEHGMPTDIILQVTLAESPISIKDAIVRSRLEHTIGESAVDELLQKKVLVLLGSGQRDQDSLIVPEIIFNELKARIIEEIRAYHESFPLRSGMPREELKSRLRINIPAFNAVLGKLISSNAVRDGKSWVALAGHEIKFTTTQQQKVDLMMTRFSASPFSPPSVKECRSELGDAVFEVLCEDHTFEKVSEEVVFRREDYDLMLEKIRNLFQARKTATLADVRDLLGTSRKYVQALLEYLDSIGITVRDGDSRHLKT